MKPKYRRALVTLDLGVSATWMDDGGEADLIRAIEAMLIRPGSGVGPGGAALHALNVECWVPGDEPEMDAKRERFRLEYPLQQRVLAFDPGAKSSGVVVVFVDHADTPTLDDATSREEWRKWADNQVNKMDQARFDRLRKDVPTHEFRAGHSGLTCVEMVVLTDGTGDICGYFAHAEIHCVASDTPQDSPTTGGSVDVHEPPPYPSESLEWDHPVDH